LENQESIQKRYGERLAGEVDRHYFLKEIQELKEVKDFFGLPWWQRC